MEAGGPLPAKDKHLQHLLVGSRDNLICCFRADSLACYWAFLHAVSFYYLFKALNIHTHNGILFPVHQIGNFFFLECE